MLECQGLVQRRGCCLEGATFEGLEAMLGLGSPARQRVGTWCHPTRALSYERERNGHYLGPVPPLSAAHPQITWQKEQVPLTALEPFKSRSELLGVRALL